MDGFSNDTAIKAVKLAFKSVFYLFKGIWKVLTFGFTAYKKHRDKKEEKLRGQTEP